MSTETVSQYLDDVARMLGGVEPGYRVEVLAGVHDHLEAALGPAPWREQEVREVLDDLGPPEEIAAAALEGQAPTSAERPSLLARPWVPPVAVTLVAIGTFVTLFFTIASGPIESAWVGGQTFVSVPEPLSFVWRLPVVALAPPAPLALLGALLVTISPLYRGVDRVAAWLALPWCLALLGLGAFILRAADTGPQAWRISSASVSADTARAGLIAVVLVMCAGLLLLFVRLVRARTTGSSDAGRWWTAAGVVLALLVSALPILLLPLTFREGADASLGAEHPVAHSSALGATLIPVAALLPVWGIAVVVLLRSRLWTRATKLIGVALHPVLLAVALAVTALPASFTPVVTTAGTVVVIAGAVITIAVATWIFMTAHRQRSPDH